VAAHRSSADSWRMRLAVTGISEIRLGAEPSVLRKKSR